MRKTIIWILTYLTIFSAFADRLTAEKVWIEGMSWIYEVQRQGETGIVTSSEAFIIGTEVEVDGKTYNKILWRKNEQCGETTLCVRAEGNRVLLNFLDRGNDIYAYPYEVCMYDFNDMSKAMTTSLCAWLNVAPNEEKSEELKFDIEGYECVFGTLYPVSFNRKINMPSYDNTYEIWGYANYPKYSELWIEGIGRVTNGDLIASYAEPIIGWEISRIVREVSLPNGQILYAYDEDLIKSENWEEAKLSTLPNSDNGDPFYFDLLGRKTCTPQPNRFYIKNGQKIIFK